MLTDAPQRAGEHPRRCCQRPGSGMAARLKQQHGMQRLKRQHGKLNSCRRSLVVHGVRYIIREHQNPRTDGTWRLPAHTRYKDNVACRRSAFGTSPSADDTKTTWHAQGARFPHTQTIQRLRGMPMVHVWNLPCRDTTQRLSGIHNWNRLEHRRYEGNAACPRSTCRNLPPHKRCKD